MTRLPAFKRPDQLQLSPSTIAWTATGAALVLSAALGSVSAALAAAGSAYAVRRLAPRCALACVVLLAALALLLPAQVAVPATPLSLLALVALLAAAGAAAWWHVRVAADPRAWRRAARLRRKARGVTADSAVAPFPGVGVDAGRSWRRVLTPALGLDARATTALRQQQSPQKAQVLQPPSSSAASQGTVPGGAAGHSVRTEESGPRAVRVPRSPDEELLFRFLRDARDAMQADVTYFWRGNVFDDALELVASSGLRGDDAPPPSLAPEMEPLVRWAAQERMVVANADDQPELFVVGPVGKGESIHGVLAVRCHDRAHLPRDRARSWLGRYAAQLARLIELIEEGHAARRYREKSQRVLRAAEMVEKCLDREELGRAVCAVATDIASATHAAFILWDEEQGVGVVQSTTDGHHVAPGFEVRDRALFAAACRERQSYAIRDARRMSRDTVLYGPSEPRRLPGSLAVVTLVGQGSCKGAIAVEGEAPMQVTAVEVDLLRMLASHVLSALENTRQFERAAELAVIDPLTGLLNRRGFEAKLSELLESTDRYGLPTSLIMIDVDHFKTVNDSYGHDAGDAVLQGLGKVIRQTVRTLDVVARYGGEELAVLLPGTGLREAEEAAERLRLAIGGRLVPAGRNRLRVTVSLGVACYPRSVTERAGLVPQADRALYEAKRGGRNCVRAAAPLSSADTP
ncbi:MAG TPA: sensor domain-containing diguanylate cyclase [Gemmatimonadaceae bacterium]|nr:sensor domain-containing diguanylate cyclase [Gemmatimonadaceae bacterium]